jgi:hypothetical protein
MVTMAPKLPNWVWVLMVIGVVVLLVALMRGCGQSKTQAAKYNKLDSLNTVLLHAITEEKVKSDSSKKAFQDSLEFERGQTALANEQKLRTENDLHDQVLENKALIAKFKLGDYTIGGDTASITVPNEFVTDCQGCFANLERTTGLVERYKVDINALESSQEKQNQLYQSRFKELELQKNGFINKIASLAEQERDAIDKLKPRGRLYLSWGVLWRPWPVAAGMGLMYQNKRNLIWGLKGYYGQGGTTVETNINIPLSLNFR